MSFTLGERMVGAVQGGFSGLLIGSVAAVPYVIAKNYVFGLKPDFDFNEALMYGGVVFGLGALIGFFKGPYRSS